MTYMTLFDSTGTRVTSVPCDNDITDAKRKDLEYKGYIEISDEEWNYYVGNKGNGANGTGYIRGKDGKPVDAPAYVPTAAEQADALAATYEAQVKGLDDQIVLAMADGDDDLVAELKEEKTAALKEYQDKLEVLR